MRLSLLSLLATCSLVFACATADDPPVAQPTSEPAPVAASPAKPAANAEPAAPAELTVSVENITKGGKVGATPVTITATSGVNQITVHFENLTHYCAPPPSFTAAVDGEVLRLVLVRPDKVSRCAIPHNLDAVIAVPGRNNLRRVVVASHDGKELGSATIGATASCYVKGENGECYQSAEAACAALGCAAGQCICTEATSNNTCQCR